MELHIMTNQAAVDEQQVTQLEHQSHEAFLQGDTETLGRILADDFIFTDPEGKLSTKAEWIADMTSGELTFESVRIDDLQVRLYGDAAVTLGRVAMKGQSKEGDFSGQYCYTAMYVKRDGRWQVVAEQANLLAQQ
jgi:ketosteroid isomerase-like protein